MERGLKNSVATFSSAQHVCLEGPFYRARVVPLALDFSENSEAAGRAFVMDSFTFQVG
jgi:hypothetical protein